MDQAELRDITEIEQLLARYAVSMTKGDIEAVLEVFTHNGTYSAFGATYGVHDFPSLATAAPQGLFLTGTPQVELKGDSATGYQPLCFVEQTNHDMRLGWYTDEYLRVAGAWRLHRRSMTFLRRNGARDSGRPHDPRRPEPTVASAG
jgi:hypothetical protein